MIDNRIGEMLNKGVNNNAWSYVIGPTRTLLMHGNIIIYPFYSPDMASSYLESIS